MKLQIWDTAGQERFRTITTAYYHGAMAIVVVFDVTDRKSFENLPRWLRNIEMHSSSPTLILCGNKVQLLLHSFFFEFLFLQIDMVSRRVVEYKDALHFATNARLPLVETSAKDAVQVDLLFESIARHTLFRLGLLSLSDDGHLERGGGPQKPSIPLLKEQSILSVPAHEFFCQLRSQTRSVVVAVRLTVTMKYLIFEKECFGFFSSVVAFFQRRKYRIKPSFFSLKSSCKVICTISPHSETLLVISLPHEEAEFMLHCFNRDNLISVLETFCRTNSVPYDLVKSEILGRQAEMFFANLYSSCSNPEIAVRIPRDHFGSFEFLPSTLELLDILTTDELTLSFAYAIRWTTSISSVNLKGACALFGTWKVLFESFSIMSLKSIALTHCRLSSPEVADFVQSMSITGEANRHLKGGKVEELNFSNNPLDSDGALQLIRYCR